MKPKIGYLLDKSYDWDEGPTWLFRTENDVLHYEIEHAPKSKVKRIVYWEIEDED
jgi:hypothetical protein